MKNFQTSKLTNLGIFSIGVSYFLYFTLQYFLTPLGWWFYQTFDSFSWMKEVFYTFKQRELEVFTIRSLCYSMLGLSAFFTGYWLLPKRLLRVKNTSYACKWDLVKAEKMFWVLFLCGFLLKTIKIIFGLNVSGAVDLNIKHGFIANPLITFYLSLNWFHLIALIVINIAYQEAKKERLPKIKRLRLRLIAFSYTFFYICATFTSGGKVATLFPVFGLLIINQYYSNKQISALKNLIPIALLIVFLFTVKLLIADYLNSPGYSLGENSSILFGITYLFFCRVSMSDVFAAVIEKGQQAYPHGTLGQFWVDMSLSKSQGNVFDGNEFGHAMGLALPNDMITGYASTNMGDLFINFNLFGILFGMLIIGLFYKTIYVNCQERYPFFVMLYALLWPILIHGMESPISTLFSVIIKMIFLSIAVHMAITFNYSWRFIAKSDKKVAANPSNKPSHADST